jgi:hypothetical protein
MVSTGYSVERACAVAVACRKNVGVCTIGDVPASSSAPTCYRYGYVAPFYFFQSAKQGRQVGVKATDFL